MAGFDPNHPTFYGESLPVWDIVSIAGTQIADGGQQAMYLYDEDSYRFTAGDRFIVGIDGRGSGLLQAGDAAVFTAVLECGPASNGTIRVSAGTDPSWDASDPSLATEQLGTFTATGASQVVTGPITSFTLQMVLDRIQPILLVEVTSGTVELRQVRVRMWPPGGPTGAWVPIGGDIVGEGRPAIYQSGPSHIAVTNAPTIPQATQATSADWGKGPQSHIPPVDDYNVYGGENDKPFRAMTKALSEAAEGLQYEFFIDYGPDASITASFAFGRRFNSTTDPTHSYSGEYSTAMAILAFEPTPLDRIEGQPAYPDPDRVPGEVCAAVRDATTGGVALSEFVEWRSFPSAAWSNNNNGWMSIWYPKTVPGMRLEWSNYRADYVEKQYMAEDALPEEQLPVLNGLGRPDPIPLNTIQFLNRPVVAIEAFPYEIVVPPFSVSQYHWETVVGSGSFVSGSSRINLGTTTARYVYRNVEYFQPGGVRPRFFVKDHDENWRAVGPGKPATDLAIFKVKTAQGWVREPRHGEDITGTGAHPLKVKVRDGTGPDAWDTVAWMTPLD